MRRAGSEAALLTLLVAVGAGAAPPAALDYGDVAPLLAERCVVCHRGEAAPLGLRLDSLAGLLAGSRNGPVVVAGDVSGSRLLRRVRGEAQPRMPLVGEPLAAGQIAMLEAWVAQGLAEGEGPPDAARPLPRPRPRPGDRVTWADVEPLVLQRCARCHSPNGILGAPPEGYRLDRYDTAVDASDRARVVPGRPELSELVRRIRGQSLPRMPFDGPPYLEAADVELLEAWVRQGARAASGEAAPLPVGARLRLGGRLSERWALDGVPLEVGPSTRVDESPEPGDRVQVRGTLQADGSLRATRLRRR
jgi:hypothetical protein